jgi:hypothetical protein
MKDKNGEQIPKWFSAEMVALVVYQGLDIHQAYDKTEQLAIQENQ